MKREKNIKNNVVFLNEENVFDNGNQVEKVKHFFFSSLLLTVQPFFLRLQICRTDELGK